jgi:hypothetical protein
MQFAEIVKPGCMISSKALPQNAAIEEKRGFTMGKRGICSFYPPGILEIFGYPVYVEGCILRQGVYYDVEDAGVAQW